MNGFSGYIAGLACALFAGGTVLFVLGQAISHAAAVLPS